MSRQTDPGRPAFSSQTPWQAAATIYAHLDTRRRRQLGWTILLMVAGAFAELATIGAVLPFLAIVSGMADSRYAGAVDVLGRFGTMVGASTIVIAAALLIAIAVAAAIIRLLLIWVSQNVVFAIAHDLATDVYDRTLHQSYSFHVSHNSSRTIAGVEKVQYVLGNVFLPAMLGSTAAVVSLFIFAGLLIVDPATTMLASLCFVALYALVSIATRKRLYRNADTIAEALESRVQALQEGLGGIRDVLLDRSQPLFLEKFRRIDSRFREAQAINQFIAAAPRYIVEAGGVILIAVLTLYVSAKPGGIVAALPMLGALALGAQRLLPLVQQVYFSWSQIYGNRGALRDVAQLLEMPPAPVITGSPIPKLASAIEFDRITYTYPSTPRPALADVSLVIPKGSRIGLVGKSGSGKSTLADLLMGLIAPTSGTLRIDGRALDGETAPGWQAQIAHVPQAIFLADSSIAANIAFGRDAAAIDMARVEAAARHADLHDFVTTLSNGYRSLVGERGVRLSGGQRQRIGIARALYKDATILILDEATSALDDATETSVMDAIALLSRDLTIVSIAHRVSTLRMCDRVFRLEGGRVVASGSYADITARKEPPR